MSIVDLELPERLSAPLTIDAVRDLCAWWQGGPEPTMSPPLCLGWDIRRQWPNAEGFDLWRDLMLSYEPPFLAAELLEGDTRQAETVEQYEAKLVEKWGWYDRPKHWVDSLIVDVMHSERERGFEPVGEGWERTEAILNDLAAKCGAKRAAAKSVEDAREARRLKRLDRFFDLDDAGYAQWIAAGLPYSDKKKIERWIERRFTEHLEKAKVTVLPFPAAPKPAAPESLALPLTFFSECRTRAPKKWIMKGVIAKGENSSTFGAPGTLKSALLTDLAIHVVAGKDWRGFKHKERCGVVYFAFERADQVRRRLAAYTVRDGLKDMPIAVAGNIVDMLNPGCVDIVVATIRVAEARLGIPVGLIIFDTWSKGIAAGGGDEDKARDQNVIAANLRRIHEQVSVHIAGIGHSGKDETRGERGSNARQGDVDLQIQITGDDEIKTATVIKANDQPEGPLTSYAGEVVALGTDEDGDPLTAFIVSTRMFTATRKNPKANPKHDRAMGALHRAVEAHGQEMPAPAGLSGRAVTLDHWREELFECGFIAHDAANPRADFKRIKEALVENKRITIRNEFVWPMGPMPEIPSRG